MRYRAEIDGLRAVAVVPVILFHAGFDLFSGGFVGVDVFFVISGYLITTIILLEKEAGTFSLLRFYERRARRILPALFLVMAACLPFAWLWLLPNDLKDFSQSLVGVSTFSSNILFWRESGYFDTSAELKPLLHTWSLAVEEQYYVFFPLLVMAVWRLGRRVVLGVLGGIALLSLIAADWGHVSQPDATFYLLPTRAWELLIGAFASFYLLHRPVVHGNQLLSLLGAGMLTYAIFFFDEHTPFPSLYTLMPTIGVALIILFTSPSTLVGRFLCNRICVGLGLTSYSAYLWHQPLFAFARHYLIGDIAPILALVLTLAALGLAFLSWKFVENPFRKKGGVSRRGIMAFSVLGTVFFLAVGFAGHFKEGFPERFYYDDEARAYVEYFENSPPRQAYFERENIPERYRHNCDFYSMRHYFGGTEASLPLEEIAPSCFTRNDSDRFAAFVWGDSHAQMLSHGLVQNMPQDWQMLQIASSGCPPRLQHEKDTSEYCAYSNWFALRAIEESRPDVVIVGQDAGHNVARMEALTNSLLKLGVQKVVFTGPSPHWRYDLPKIVLRKFWESTPQRTFVGIEQGVMLVEQNLHANFVQNEASIFVSIIDSFCNEDGCLVFLGEDRKTGVTSWDYGHLTPIASDFFAKESLVSEITNIQAE